MKDLHTFGELIRENKIVIPKIQRDYVQGSNAQKEKRDEFLAVLLDHLVSDTEYHLDFIYGTGGTDQGEFLPLDGQQRLTTIFLIHWVLSQRAGIRDIDAKDYFSYQTRRSSELFCQKLIQERIDFGSFIEGQTITGYIRKEVAWYLKQWDTDPTIQAMLDMIDATDAAISESRYREHWVKMCKNSVSLLKFDCLNMKDFHLSDSLYVKMNERGKQLTSFENWKARFIKFLADRYANDQYKFIEKDRENYTGIKDYFVQSIEHQWSDIFWTYAIEKWKSMPPENRKDKPYPVIDGYFERYIEYIHEFHFYLKKPKINGENVKTSDYTNKFGQQCSTYDDIEYLSLIFRSLDVFVNIKSENGSITNFFNEIFYCGNDYVTGKVRLFSKEIPEGVDLFKYCVSNKREDCLVTIQILLYSIIQYCQENKCYKPCPELIRYVRVMRNLIDGVRQFLTKDLSYRSNIRLNEISNYEKTIRHLCSAKDVDSLLHSCPVGLGTIAHEVAKNKLRSKYTANNIDALEDYSLFHGNLTVVEYVLNENTNYDDLVEAISEFNKLSDTKKIQILIAQGYRGIRVGWSSYQTRFYYGCQEKGWEFIFMYTPEKEEALPAVAKSFNNYVREYIKYRNTETILKTHEKDEGYIGYALKYDDFLESAGKLYYYAGYYYDNPTDLRIVSLQRASSRPLSGYHCEPFAHTVVNRLHSENKEIKVSSWGSGGHRGAIHCETLNLKLKSYTNHWKIDIDSPDKVSPEHKSLQQVLSQYKSVYNLSWNEDCSSLIMPLLDGKDLVETCVSFIKDLLE